jgi:hypothetical protein
VKILPVRAEFIVRTDAWADGQADRPTDGQSDRHMTKLTVAFHNFAIVPKNHLASQCYRILLQKPTATQFREIFFSYGAQGSIAVFITMFIESYPQPRKLSELAIVCYTSWYATVKGDEHTHTHSLSLSLCLNHSLSLSKMKILNFNFISTKSILRK